MSKAEHTQMGLGIGAKEIVTCKVSQQNESREDAK